MSGPVAFDQRSVEKLIAMYRQMRLELTNTQRVLRALGPQHHQGSLLPGLGRARLTETMDDSKTVVTAKKMIWSDQENKYIESNREMQLRCFLRPSGETIEANTRVYYARIGKLNEIIVVNCEPDSE